MQILSFTKQDALTLWNLANINVRDRYLGSVLGFFWVVLQPLLLFSIYTLVFGFVFTPSVKAADTTFSYVVWMISGYVPFMVFSDSLSQSSNSVIAGAPLVKNIVFKSELLPISSVMGAFIPGLVGFLFVFVLLLVDGKWPSVNWVFLPALVLLQMLFQVALAFFISATAVFLRDVIFALPSLLTVLLFSTPIFYPLESLPAFARKIEMLNPLYHLALSYRNVLVNGTTPEWGGILYVALLSLVLFVAGLNFFRKLKGFFELAL